MSKLKKIKCFIIKENACEIRNGKIAAETIEVKHQFDDVKLFEIDPLSNLYNFYTGIRKNKISPLVFIDANTHKTISVFSNEKFDGKKFNELKWLSQRSFWEAFVKRIRLTVWQILIYMMSGYGIFRFSEYVIFALMGKA